MIVTARLPILFLTFVVVAAPLPARANGAPAADPEQPTEGAPDEWDSPRPATQDPQPASQPPNAEESTPVPAPRLESPPDHEADDEPREGRGAKIVMHTGLGLLSGGVAALLFVALPSRLLKRRALERYESADTVYQERAWLDRAYRRDLAMQISAGIGLGLITAGASLAIGGAIARRSARRDMATRARPLVVTPALDGFMLRF